MISTRVIVSKPSFLALIASITPHKSLQLQTRLWSSTIRPACQKCHYQTGAPRCSPKTTRVFWSCVSQVKMLRRQRPLPASCVTARYSSNSSDIPNKSREILPSEDEGRRSNLSKRFSHLMDHVQSNIFIAGQRLNDLTGYSGIEALKKDIEEQGQSLLCKSYNRIHLTSSTEKFVQTTRFSLQRAREAYSAAISQRSASQREVNELLQRKHAWTSNDLERFTALYRSDHANEQAESAAQEHLAALERKAEEAASKLSASILARYHEEQIWSDKIRRMSTWGTWGLMGMNVLLFLVFQIGVEPWRRKRLVKGFEDKVMEALAEREGPVGVFKLADDVTTTSSPRFHAPEIITPDEQQNVIERTVEPEMTAVVGINEEGVVIARPAAGGMAPTTSSKSTFEKAKESLRDIFSNRQIVVRRLDMTIVAFEGAAAGMALVGLALLLRLYRS